MILCIDEDDIKVNSISWDPFESKQFISGSGPNLKLWSTDLDKSIMSFMSVRRTGDNIMSVQFNQKSKSILAAAKTNGEIDLWDLRKNSFPYHTFQAHLINSSINCLDWHPNDENILISGSSDRLIKVWNLQPSYLGQ